MLEFKGDDNLLSDLQFEFILHTLIPSDSLNSNNNNNNVLNEQITTLMDRLTVEFDTDSSNETVNLIKGITSIGIVAQSCCKCTRSQCRKRYCPCFKKGIMCSSCPYRECCNQLKPYYQVSEWYRKPTPTTCNCKHTECLKKYCICYANGKGCSNSCKCIQCLNKTPTQDQTQVQDISFLS